MVAFALLKGAPLERAAGRHQEAARRPPLGHRPARLRAAGAARRTARQRDRVRPELRDHRRRPARPGRAPRGRPGVPTFLHVPSANLIPLFLQRRRAPLHLRGPRVRRPHRPAQQLRAVERDGRPPAAELAKNTVAGRRDRAAVRRRHPRRRVLGDGAGAGRAAGRRAA